MHLKCTRLLQVLLCPQRVPVYVYLYLHAYLAAISLTAAVPLPVVGGQVLVLVFHHYLHGSCTCKQECRAKFFTFSQPGTNLLAVW